MTWHSTKLHGAILLCLSAGCWIPGRAEAVSEIKFEPVATNRFAEVHLRGARLFAVSNEHGLIAGAGGRRIQIVRIEPPHKFEVDIGHHDIVALSFSEDGSELAAATTTGKILFLTLATRKVRDCDGVPKASQVEWVGNDLVILNTEGEMLRVQTGEKGAESSLITNNVKLIRRLRNGALASANREGRVEIWNVAQERAIRTLRTQGPAVDQLFASATDNHLGVCDENRITIWDIETGRAAKVLPYTSGGFAIGSNCDWVAMSPDPRLIYGPDMQRRLEFDSRSQIEYFVDDVLVTLGNEAVRIFSDVSNPRPYSYMSRYRFDHLAFSPDGSRLAGFARTGTQVWQVPSMTSVNSSGLGERVVLAISDDSQSMFLRELDGVYEWSFDESAKKRISRFSDIVHLRSLPTGDWFAIRKLTTSYQVIGSDDSERYSLPLAKSIQITNDGARLWLLNRHSVSIWDSESGRLTGSRTFENMSPICVSSDGQYLATLSDPFIEDNATMAIWETSHFSVVAHIPYTQDVVAFKPADETVIYAQDEKLLASTLDGMEARVIELTAGQLGPLPQGVRIEYIQQLATSRDSSRIAVAYETNASQLVDVIDTRTWSLVRRTTLPYGELNCDDYYLHGLMLSDDGRTCILPTSATVFVWDLATGCIAHYGSPPARHGTFLSKELLIIVPEWGLRQAPSMISQYNLRNEKVTRLWPLEGFERVERLNTGWASTDGSALFWSSASSIENMEQMRLAEGAISIRASSDGSMLGVLRTLGPGKQELSIFPSGERNAIFARELDTFNLELAVSKNAEYIAVGDVELKVIDRKRGRVLDLKDQFSASCVAFLPDEQILLIADHDSVLSAWKLPEMLKIGESAVRHFGSIKAIAVNSEGSWIATAGTDRTVQLWRITKESMAK